jgi:hypothetical protein
MVPLYYHHGIEVRGNKVVHYGEGSLLGKKNAELITSTMDEFLKGGKKEVVNSPDRDSVFMILSRVYSRLKGKKAGYNLAFNNCEHFARWAETGKMESEQVQTATKVGIAAATIAAGILLKRRLGEDVIERINFVLKD